MCSAQGVSLVFTSTRRRAGDVPPQEEVLYAQPLSGIPESALRFHSSCRWRRGEAGLRDIKGSRWTSAFGSTIWTGEARAEREEMAMGSSKWGGSMVADEEGKEEEGRKRHILPTSQHLLCSCFAHLPPACHRV